MKLKNRGRHAAATPAICGIMNMFGKSRIGQPAGIGSGFTLAKVGEVAASLLVRHVAMIIRIGQPIDISDIVERGRGASRHLFLQYAFDVAALLVTELPFSRADVVVHLIT
jgi:hypothetical protein